MIPEYENEELTINPTQVFNAHNLTLKPNQPKEPPFTDHMKAICNLDVHVDSKALKPSSQTKKEAFTRAPNQYKEYLSEVWYTTKTLHDSKGKRNSQKEFPSSWVKVADGSNHAVFRSASSFVGGESDLIKGMISDDEDFCDDDSAIFSGEDFEGNAEASDFESMFSIPSSTTNLLKVGSSRGLVKISEVGPDLSGKSINETQYRGMIRLLMYLTASRPDIQFSTCLCARYQANPKESHLIVVKKNFRYSKGTSSLGLWYPKCLGFDLKGYSDSNYAGCNMDRKRTSGACQLLRDKLVCWSAKKKQYVAMTSAKADNVVVVGCCTNILWMKSQITDYDIIYEKVPIFCENTSAIAILNNSVLYSRTKHIDIRYHFIRDHVLKGDTELHVIPTQYQLTDIFTKPLDEPTFKRLVVELGMLNIDSKPDALALPEEN
nr:retrovirus-related Pol polyprotein from transposon TNT 1-94 [Tanacetum cinerariifolium]